MILPARRITFGMNERRYRPGSPCRTRPTPAVCRRCGADLEYNALYVSHLGRLALPALHGRAAAARHRRFSEIALKGVESLAGDRSTKAREPPVGSAAGVPGLYNAYNVLAADGGRATRSACSRTMSPGRMAALQGGLRAHRAGRTSTAARITLALVKNPVGFNEVLRMLTMATDGSDRADHDRDQRPPRRRPRRLLALGCRFRAAGRWSRPR